MIITVMSYSSVKWKRIDSILSQFVLLSETCIPPKEVGV